MTFTPPAGWIPPFQDLRTLAQHVGMSEHTIEKLVREGRFPEPRRNKCGKFIWVWDEVERHMKAPDDDLGGEAERIRLAVMRISNAKNR